MSLTLIANASAVAPNLTVPFSGMGGSAPYTYSMMPGGAGGTISPDGIYKAPSVTGADTVKVTDVMGDTATLDITIGSPLELLCDIIQSELGLEVGKVYLWGQKVAPRTDGGIYVVVSSLSSKAFASSQRTAETNAGLELVQSVNMKSTVSIDIMSRTTEARDRKEEIVMALNSVYSEQQQTLNGFKIASIPQDFVNLSGLDGAAIPYRFNISVNIQYFITKRKLVPYYNNFAPAQYVAEP